MCHKNDYLQYICDCVSMLYSMICYILFYSILYSVLLYSMLYIYFQKITSKINKRMCFFHEFPSNKEN